MKSFYYQVVTLFSLCPSCLHFNISPELSVTMKEIIMEKLINIKMAIKWI